jgi:hypothetical protein
MSQPEINISSAPPLFDASGKLIDERRHQQVKKFLDALAVGTGRRD